PTAGVLAGTGRTAILQSSSASGCLRQAVAGTGPVSYGAAMPIIMGQNIGTCATAMLSSFGTTKNARRAAFVHLSFNILGTLILLLVFLPVSLFLKPPLLDKPASLFGIALTHSAFNILCTFLLLPTSSLLEWVAVILVPYAQTEERTPELDDRLLAAPHIALDRCYTLVREMAEISTSSLKNGMKLLTHYDKQTAKEVKESEEKCDHYEDILGTYLVKLSNYQMSDADSGIVSMMLKVIGDLERISDHSVNILKSAEELREKRMQFTPEAIKELEVLCSAVSEIMTLSCTAFVQNDLDLSRNIEPLEQVIDDLKEEMRNAHVVRLKKGTCSIETGFIWLDLLTNLERAADHCSNIAICIVDTAGNSMNLHHSLSVMKEESPYYKSQYAFYSEKYVLPETT
ncbi:MAG: Na/Pi symporter, partial [Lachnospiraceae bacterium]|nr:Na/Pi symporter [Lachnospiraceae bacterium]